MVEITHFSPSDIESVVDLFRKNVPDFFHPSEESHLRQHLIAQSGTYYLLRNESLIACGGFVVDKTNKSARVCWDFVAPEFHGTGYGSLLLKHRLDIITKLPGIQSLEVHTSQFAYRFYEKHGFTIAFSEKDHWAKGYDLVAMTRNL